MTYEEIQKYLNSGCIVRNEEFEYKIEGKDLLCREIGTEKWWYVYMVGEYEKKMKWEIVSEK